MGESQEQTEYQETELLKKQTEREAEQVAD
jgi:hypothetical protein